MQNDNVKTQCNGMIKRTLLYSVVFIIFIIAGVFILANERSNAPRVTNFNECVLAGKQVLESYPRQCKYGDRTFIEEIDNELAMTDIIRVDTPRPNQKIQSPLIIQGQARGNWFFEASFPISLIDANSNDVSIQPSHIMTADEWMTSEFVTFSAVVNFDVDATMNGESGTLILQKDNPSGLPDHDDQLVIPVIFK